MSTQSNAGDYRQIMVALDGSPVAEEALPYALAQARAFDARIVLLQVLPTLLPILPPTGGATAAERDAETPPGETARSAERYLEAIAANLRSYGVTVISCVRRGPVAATILQEAEAQHADLLVLSTHGAGAIPRMLAGSVATQIAPRAPCPVLLVRTGMAAPTENRVRSFDDDAAHYGTLVPRPLGLRTVALRRIVGSVGRARELNSDFMPRRKPKSDSRFKRIRSALERGEILPPIELYKLGYDYYVLDGNHRVAMALDLGQQEIDAVVTEYLPIDDADRQRVFLERRSFENATGLTRVGALRPGHFPRLEEMIRAYAAREGIADLKEAASLWYLRVYRPLAARLRAAQIARLFPGERTADMAVHLEDLRAAEEQRLGRAVSPEQALEVMLARYRRVQRHALRRIPGLGTLLRRRTPAADEE